MNWKKTAKKSIVWIMLLCFAVLIFGEIMPVRAAEENNTISGTIEVSSNVGKDYMQQYITDFEKKYPQVKVQYHYYEDYENAIQQRLPKGNYGDVLFIPGFVRASDYAKYFLPLGDYLALSKKYNYLESSKYSGLTVYGIPSSAYMAGILYNKDVFYQAGITDTPKSIDEFLTDLEYIKQRTNAIPFYTNYAATWALEFWEYFPYIEMTGNPDYKEIEFVNEKNPFLRGTTHYQVYNMLYDIVKEGLSESNPVMSNWVQSKSMLNQGKIGCMVIGSWAVSQVKEAGPNPDSVAFMPFPNEINGRQYMTISTDYCYGINKNTKNPEAAKAFIDFMLDESGYALDHETLSLVKTDPYPDAYGDMDNVILLSNSPATSESYQKKQKLTAKLNLETDTSEIKRVIEAAIGSRDEDFDEIAQDWNRRWESSRTANMTVTESSGNVISESTITGEYEVNFSQTEQDYLDQVGDIRVGYLTDMAPFEYENEDGFTGLASGICDLIEKDTGLTFTYYGYENTQALVEALEAGAIDIAAGIDKNAEYENAIKFSKAYLSSMKVVVKNDTADMGDTQTYGKPATVKGEKIAYTDQESDAGKEYDTLTKAIRAVENMEADYVVTDYYSADYYMRELECSHTTIVPLSGMSDLSLAFSDNVDTRLVSICNKCIYGVADETIQIMLREYTQPPVQQVTLKRFIEANPLICIAVICVIFVLIIASIMIIMLEKNHSAKKHELDMKRYEMLASMVDEYIFEYDFKSGMIHFDTKFAQKFGLQEQFELETEQCDSEDMKKLVEYCTQALEKDNSMSPEFMLTDKEDSRQWYRLIGRLIRDSADKPVHLIGKLVNVQKEMEEKLEITDQAQRDSLTGLYNRYGFSVYFEKTYTELDDVELVTFAVMDLDNFKGVNDTLGHAGGDEALILLARNMEKIFAENTLLARYGGDEFTLCVIGMSEQEVRDKLEQLVRSMDCEFTYQGNVRKLSISLGAVYTEQKLPMAILFKEADKVLYKTKEAGKNGYRLIHHLDGI